MAAEVAANQTIRTYRNHGATSRQSIPTKHRRLAIRVARLAAAINRNRLLPTVIRTGIRHKRNRDVALIHTRSSRNRATTIGRRPTSKAPSGLNGHTPIPALEIRRNSNSVAPLAGIPILTKMAAKRSMIGRMNSTGAAGVTGHRCRK
jgi:hypothetical protein